ncbi:MAG TPA: hypothetical protein VGA69_03205 [Nitriliruptorales bacterium]
MSIDRLASSSYRARVLIARQRYTATFPTRHDAEDWLALTRARAAAGELAPRITVEQYAARWLDTAGAVPDASRDGYALHLERHVLPRLGDASWAMSCPPTSAGSSAR